MKRRGLLVALVPVVLLLSACTPGASTPGASQPASPSASASPSAAASPSAPTAVDPAGYITDGAVGTTDVAWNVLYSFYTDSSKKVLCALAVNSETPPSAYCWVVKGQESSVKYDVPPPVTGQCDQADSAYTGDGYEVGLGVFQRIGVDAGFVGCRELETDTPAVLSSKVIPDNSTITGDDIICTVNSGVAVCGYATAGNGTKFTFGLATAQFTF